MTLQVKSFEFFYLGLLRKIPIILFERSFLAQKVGKNFAKNMVDHNHSSFTFYCVYFCLHGSP